MRATPTNPYSFYNANGDENRDAEGNLRWKSIVDLLTAVIADVDQPAEERDRAAEVLKFYAAKEQERLVTGEINPAVARMFATMGAHSLWEWPDKCAIETVTGQDGITRQHVNRRREQDEPLPMRTPVPTFEPAVPLPVMQVSDVELSALALQEKRFSPENVSANVAAIIKESGPTSVITAPVIPPSAEEQKAIAGITITSPTNEKIATIQQDGVKPLTTVQSIEAQINEERDVRARYDAAQETLARLIALRDQQA